MQLRLPNTSLHRASTARRTPKTTTEVCTNAGRTKISAATCGPPESRVQELRLGQIGHQQRLPEMAGIRGSVRDQQQEPQVRRGADEIIVPHGGSSHPLQPGREIFKNGRGKQFSIYRERIYDRGPGKWILAFRSPKIAAMSHTKDFFEQVAVQD